MKNDLPYPDNLWVAVFGDELPIPPDAAETLEILINEEDRPHARQILELRFKEGKSIKEVSEIVGRSGNRVRQIINESGRKMRHPKKTHIHNAALKYGIAASKRIADGTAEICFECGKLIEMNNSVYLVPSNDMAHKIGQPFSRFLITCCSEECAKQSIETDLKNHYKGLEKLSEEKAAHEDEMARLKSYQPEPLAMATSKTLRERLRSHN